MPFSLYFRCFHYLRYLQPPCGGSDAKENTASANASVSETEQGEATEQDAQEEEPITCTLTVWSPSEDQDPEYGQWLNKVYPLSRTL